MSVQLLTTQDDDADIRLDRWLRRKFPHLTQGAIQKWCRTGQVRVDGQRVDTNTRLEPGQTVRVPPVPEAPPVKKKNAMVISPDDERMLKEFVLYKDEQLIVINKPPGLPTQGGNGITRHLDGMLDELRFGHEERPRLVHRLDRDTSGVLVLARTPGVAAKLAALFRGRDIKKVYWAVVTGRPTPPEGIIDQPLKRVHGGGWGERTEPAERRDPGAMHAITDYQTMDYAAKKLAWLELSPRTGRTHQLRVHCASLGTPIYGDVKYGRPETPEEDMHVEGMVNELHLHARSLTFPHPAGGHLTVHAPLAAHMAETFKLLGFDIQKTPKPKRGK